MKRVTEIIFTSRLCSQCVKFRSHRNDQILIALLQEKLLRCPISLEKVTVRSYSILPPIKYNESFVYAMSCAQYRCVCNVLCAILSCVQCTVILSCVQYAVRNTVMCAMCCVQ